MNAMRRKELATAIVLVRQEQIGIDPFSSIHELVPSEAIHEQRQVIFGSFMLQQEQAGELLGELLAHHRDLRLCHYNSRELSYPKDLNINCYESIHDADNVGYVTRTISLPI